jgi:hypothetical protein
VHETLNPNCNYTSVMNGTSAATPTVSGVAALMLEANPRLTWRDVRVILAKTARRVDAQRVAAVVTLPSGEPYSPEPAWTLNGAGMWFDNQYGFGLVDAAAAVAMARDYKNYLTGPMKSSGAKLSANFADQPQEIPVGTASGVEIPFEVTDAIPVSKVEAVQVVVILNQAAPRDLAVELVSPSGTRSVLLQAYNVLQGTGIEIPSLTLASNTFLGESAKGVWKLRLIDVGHRADASPMAIEGSVLHVMGS